MEHIKVENGVYIVNAKEDDLYIKVIGNVQYIFQLKNHYDIPVDYTKKLIDLTLAYDVEPLVKDRILRRLSKTDLFDVLVVAIATCSHTDYEKSTDDTRAFYRDYRIWYDAITDGQRDGVYSDVVVADKATKEVLSRLSLTKDRVENLITGGVIYSAVYVERPWVIEKGFTTSVKEPYPGDYLNRLTR